MKRNIFMSLIIVALAIFLSASVTLASYIDCNTTSYLGGLLAEPGNIFYTFLYDGRLMEYGSGGPGSFGYTAISPGPFHLEVPFTVAFGFVWESPPWDNGVTEIRIYDGTRFSTDIRVWECWGEDDPHKLFFDTVNVSVTMNGVTQTSEVGGLPPTWIWPDGYPELAGGAFVGGPFFCGLLDTAVPVTWWEDQFGSRRGSAVGSNFFTGTLILDGHVSEVPIPSALLLLGSGLASMAIYRRKKLMGCR
jgi:hypothetical protein